MYYEIEKTNVRILGSMHLFPAGHPEVPTWVLKAYEWCQEIVFESDEAAASQSMLANGKPALSSRLPKALFERLEAIWPSDGSLPALESFTPCGVFLVLPRLYAALVPGVEPILRPMAVSQGRKMWRLESATELCGILDAISESTYINHVQHMVENVDTGRRGFAELYEAWLTCDPEVVLTAASKTPLWNSPLRQPLIDGRNLAWAPIITAAWPSRRTLIVVGALHLAGPNSVLELIRKTGKTVLRINS